MESKSAARTPKRWLAGFLALLLCFSCLPAEALGAELASGKAVYEQSAAVQQGQQPEILETPDGEIAVEDDWNTAFPYGTFAFGSYQADVGEAGAKTAEGETLPESVLIPVYRLGGTTGAVTVKITFSPAITTDAEGENFVYDYAASGRDDLLIEFEDPNPIAAYQTVGMPKWQREMLPGSVTVITDMPENAAEGASLVLRLSEDVKADSYRWQAKQNGNWQDLKQFDRDETAENKAEAAEAGSGEEAQQATVLDSSLCTDPTVETTWDLLWDFASDAWTGTDLRCIYTVDGRAYCSESLMGEAYAPIQEPAVMPEGLTLPDETGFTALEADDAYGLYEFDLTFADGETVKYIRVTALDDAISELPELALFTITGCCGGELSAACNTMTLMVSDNDEAGPSALGFTKSKLAADRGTCTVNVPVRREGDKSYNVTVHYETVDGTAKAGVDYARTEGELSFAGSIDEIEIPVELIANDAQEDRSFTVRLTQLQGGGEKKRCEMTTQEITVTLTGTAPAAMADGSGRNLATVLANPEGREIAGSITVAEDALLADSRAVLQGDTAMQPSEALKAELVIDPDTRSVEPEDQNGKVKLKFSRGSNYSGYWKDWENLINDGDYNRNDAGEYADTAQGYYVSYNDLGISHTPKGAKTTAGYGLRESAYKGILITTNWENEVEIVKDDTGFTVGDKVYPMGDYFWKFKIDVEWKNVGVQKTVFAYSAHRYLLPKVWYNDGASNTTFEFRTSGSQSSLTPSSRTMRVFTDGSNGLKATSGSGSNWVSGEPESEGCGANSIGFGRDLKLYVNQRHCFTWTTESTDKNWDLCNYDGDSQVDIRRLLARRRTFNKTRNGIGLVLYTANDANENNGNGIALDPTSLIYNNLKPEVSLVKGMGGVAANGDLYVGSAISVKVPKAYGFSAAQKGVFLTSSTGRKIMPTQHKSDTTSDTFQFTMMWDNMCGDDEDATYALHVVYNRQQTLQFNVSYSASRNADGTISEDDARNVLNNILANATIRFLSPSAGVNSNDSAFGSTSFLNLSTQKDRFTYKGNGIFEWDVKASNLLEISFRLDSGDKLVLNGVTIDGNGVFKLNETDLKEEVLTVQYFRSDCLTNVSPMFVTIQSMELYFDSNYDGTPETLGIQEGEGGDQFISYLRGEYPDSVFKPVTVEVTDDHGNVVNTFVRQYYLRVNYTLSPRAFIAPSDGKVHVAQILPGFASGVTGIVHSPDSTPEMDSYRWVVGTGLDGKEMYGGAASAPSCFYIALGGDASKPEMRMLEELVPDPDDPDEQKYESVTQYTWTPKYVGQLLVPFENPTPITISKNITGKPVQIAGQSVTRREDGSYAYTFTGKTLVNAYLGSFTGRSVLVVGVQEQVKPTSGAGMISSLNEIDPETVCIGNLCTTPSPDDLNNLEADDDPGPANGTAPGAAIDMADFSPDLGLHLPSLEFPLGEYASIVADGNQVGFTIGFPIFKYEDTSYNSVTSSDNGSTTSHEIDSDGNPVNTVTSDGGKKVVTTTEMYDSSDGNQRTLIVETVTKDDQGNTTTKKEKVAQKRNAQNKTWEDAGHREVITDAPAAPSQQKPLSDRAQENFVEANSQLATVGNFIKACASKDKGSLWGFMRGQGITDDSLKGALNGNSRMRKTAVAFSVQLAIMFEYNPIDDGFYFKSAGLSATVGFELTLQARLPCPIFYVYLKVGCSVQFSASMSVLRKAVCGAEITDFKEGSLTKLAAGECRSVVFALDMRESDGAQGARGFKMNLNGRVFMSVYGSSDLNATPLATGALNGNGGEQEVLFEAYNKIIYVKLQATGAEKPVIESIKPILKAASKTVFDGISITPSVSLELGVGIGVEFLKFEVFLKTNVAITLTMGGYNDETEGYEGFYVSSFAWNIALGFNITILFVNYSMDVIAFGVEGAQTNGTGGYFTWNISATAASGLETIWSKTTYTTALGGDLKEPTPATGTNIFKDKTDMTFYNRDGKATELKNPGNNESWWFRTNVSPNKWWGGGLYDGESPLNNDLAEATAEGAYVTIKLSEPEIDLFFKGKVDVRDSNGKTTTYTESPARISTGANGISNSTITITARTAGTRLDRYSVPGSKQASAPAAAWSGSGSGESLVHITRPTDISAEQRVFTPTDTETRAFDPTATDDFQLSGYSTSGDAKKLTGNLATGYSYKLAQAGDDVYIAYPLMLDNKPQLVLSRLVMTGDLTAQGSGLIHPLDPENSQGWLLLDDDGFTDLEFALDGSADKLTVSWVTYANDSGTSWKLKSREIDLTAGTAGALKTLQTSSSSISLTTVTSGDVLWTEAFGTGAEANAKFKQWLLATQEGLDEDMLPDPDAMPENLPVSKPSLANAVFYWATKSVMNKLYGDGTILKSRSGKSITINSQIENLEAVTLDGKTYVLYTTTDTEYFDTSRRSPLTVGLNGISKDTELALIHQLWLLTLDGSGFGEPMLLQTVMDFYGCSDSNLAEAKLKDGVYAESSLVQAKADPYFSNLSFLKARIDGNGPQTLALFEMNGNSYLITEANLKSAAAGKAATLQPIFSETTGTEVTIGSDGTNMAAVYTAPVANSLSNAIYIAWWDEGEQAWGAPTILAMRYLQVYEDAITYDIDPADLEKIYLGIDGMKTPGGSCGDLDKLTFSNLQMAVSPIHVNEETTENRLLVLTEGSLLQLQQATFDMGSGHASYETLIPADRARVGFYAIAFGAGQQALGEGNLGLNVCDFTAGSTLVGEVSFTNTGTAAIRASEKNPAKIQLTAGSEVIAKWNLNKSLASGQSLQLTFKGLPLNQNLPAGTVFRLTVQEDPDYVEQNPFYGSLDLLTVEQRPELTLSGFEARLDHVENGVAYLDVNCSVLNNGSADAGEVFLQFTYATGKYDADGVEEYKPINIIGSTLTASDQKPLRSPQHVDEDYSHGVWKLQDAEGGTVLEKGHYRNVSGWLCVPTSCFLELEQSSGLHLRAELYSNFDTPNYDDGLYSSDHNEYNGLDNQAATVVRHGTFFTTPYRISTALGTTLRLPVTYTSTSAHPDIVVNEISDGTADWTPRMGLCYYDREHKLIVAAPNSTAEAMLAAGQVPTGILQIKDRSTNSITAITYQVGSMAEGVNIYKDDASFTFYDYTHQPIDVTAPDSHHPDWSFISGGNALVGWTGGAVGEIPMNGDLAVAKEIQTSVEFKTTADTLTFYFMGTMAIVDDTHDEVAEESPYTFHLNNPNGALKTVTLVSWCSDLRIDRYVATYGTNPVPDTDPTAPKILWNRSFPDPASIKPPASLKMICYILYESVLQSVTLDGQPLSETSTPKLVKVDANLWYFEYEFTDNLPVPLQVEAMDGAGNSSVNNTDVNWFNEVPSIGAISGAPGLDRSHLSFVDGSGSPASPTGILREAPYLRSSYAPGENETSSAQLFENGGFGSALGKSGGERWLAMWKGYYQVRVDREDGTWARAIIPLQNLDVTQPTIDLEGDGTPASPYLIKNRNDWLKLKAYMDAGQSTEGMTFLQTADFRITEADSIRSNRFMGVYDGGGHTLTFDAEMEGTGLAPFENLENAVIRNLRVAGTMKPKGKFAAGFAMSAYGNCFIENCRSSIQMQSQVDGDGTHGGFIAVNQNGTLTMTGCTFDGSFLGTKTVLCGGFVGWNNTDVVIRDSVFAPSKWESGRSANFSRLKANTSTITLTNSYYGEVHPDNQGVRGWKVLPGNRVELSFGPGTIYDTAGIKTAEIGLTFDGKFYAGSGEIVSLTPRYTGDPANAEPLFLADAGTLEETRASGWTLTMPDQDVTITMPNHEWTGAIWYEWTEDNSVVFAKQSCAYNPSHIMGEMAYTNFILTKPSTFEEEGYGYFIAEFADPRFETQIKEIVIPPVACKGGEACPSLAFTDMPSIESTMHIPIDWAVINKITTGTSPTTFGTKNACTRAQFVTFLWRTRGQPEPTSTDHPFKDVKESAFYYKAMLWAVEEGITAGTSPTTFSPNKPCSRAQVVTFLWRMEGQPEPSAAENPFTDVKTSGFYYKAMLWAVGKNITTGTSPTTFSPNNNCTRAQCVTFLYREFAQ